MTHIPLHEVKSGPVGRRVYSFPTARDDVGVPYEAHEQPDGTWLLHDWRGIVDVDRDLHTFDEVREEVQKLLDAQEALREERLYSEEEQRQLAERLLQTRVALRVLDARREFEAQVERLRRGQIEKTAHELGWTTAQVAEVWLGLR